MEIDITGARIFYTFPFEIPILGKLQITETMVISWVVMLLITGLCIWLAHDLKVEHISKRQALAEWLVEKANRFVVGNMGEEFRYLIPFVAALFSTSLVSNLISLVGLRSPTADLSTEAAWAAVVFVMITGQKIKTNGVGGYMKSFTTPIPVMTPFNILSELATPISMALPSFWKYSFRGCNQQPDLRSPGAGQFRSLRSAPRRSGGRSFRDPLPGCGNSRYPVRLFRLVFPGFMQAFIFCMLTVMYIKGAAEA